MESVIVIGSGPAAAGCVAGLLANGKKRITVLDIGSRLPASQLQLVEQAASLTIANWSPELRTALYPNHYESPNSALPDKLVLGSDYPLADYGQMSGVSWVDGKHPNVVSGALGGFSNIWGGQAYPFSSWALRKWPDSGRSMPAAYTAIRKLFPIAGQADSLLEYLPGYGPLSPLPELAVRTQRMLHALQNQQSFLRGFGIHVGATRVALDSTRCVQCGLCNGGCVWDLIFSSRHLFYEWINQKRITYRDGIKVESLTETESGATVNATTRHGEHRTFFANRIFLGAGAVGTSKIVLNSLPDLGELMMQECRQLIVPLMFYRPAPIPQACDTFALGQAGMYFSPLSSQEAFLQLYPYDPSFVSALPQFMRRYQLPTNTLLRHLAVGLLYFNSEQSPCITIKPSRLSHHQTQLELSGTSLSKHAPIVEAAFRQLRIAGKHGGFFPILPLTRVAPAGRSYHWGGQFPYHADSTSPLCSDRFGRLSAWRNVHLIDASTFPTLGPTGFLLTIMANAYRIATEASLLETNNA